MAWGVLIGNPLMALGPMILAAQAFSAAVRIPQNLLGIKPSLAAAERLSKFQRSPSQIVEQVHAVELPRRLQRGVEVDQVVFGYDKDSVVLDDLSLRLRPGTITALIGENAAGKTTLFEVLQRKYDVRSGSIRIDGVDICNATLDSLDRLIGRSVPQQDWILSGTLRENLVMGLSNVTDQQLRRVCQRTGLDAWLTANADGKGSTVDCSARRAYVGVGYAVAWSCAAKCAERTPAGRKRGVVGVAPRRRFATSGLLRGIGPWSCSGEGPAS
jgi:ATP-binding cassette subfamily B protein